MLSSILSLRPSLLRGFATRPKVSNTIFYPVSPLAAGFRSIAVERRWIRRTGSLDLKGPVLVKLQTTPSGPKIPSRQIPGSLKVPGFRMRTNKVLAVGAAQLFSRGRLSYNEYLSINLPDFMKWNESVRKAGGIITKSFLQRWAKGQPIPAGAFNRRRLEAALVKHYRFPVHDGYVVWLHVYSVRRRQFMKAEVFSVKEGRYASKTVNIRFPLEDNVDICAKMSKMAVLTH